MPTVHIHLGVNNTMHINKYQDDKNEADRLYKNVRVLIWVMTSPKNLETKARTIKNTWGKRPNKIIFFSSETNTSFPTIGLNTSEGRAHLTAKTMQGFRYVYKHHINDVDWFMKADDDTYVIVENLRYFLSEQNSSNPEYSGHLFKPIVKQGYNSGGAGYVLSKEALLRLATNGSNPDTCRQDGGDEDVEFGKCMEKLGVKTVNTTDRLGRSRFHGFEPIRFISGNYWPAYGSYDSNGARSGIDSVSDYAITFHYIQPHDMLMLEYMIYHLKPYGIRPAFKKLNFHNRNRLLSKST